MARFCAFNPIKWVLMSAVFSTSRSVVSVTAVIVSTCSTLSYLGRILKLSLNSCSSLRMSSASLFDLGEVLLGENRGPAYDLYFVLDVSTHFPVIGVVF